ncbi:MAG: sucrase ferredoxin [Pseudomonadales bacterium]
MTILPTPPPPPCAEAFVDSPMPGTAEVVDVWIMLEQRASWPARAVGPDGLPVALFGWLAEQIDGLAAMGLRARGQLIRQETRDAAGRRLLLGFGGALFALPTLVDAQLQQLDLAAVVQAVQHDKTPVVPAQRLSGPHYFVCTNGRRDQCCARLGLPVYRRLRTMIGARAWRTTHVGGHRFATNVLTLGSGLVYGRVQETDCDALVAATEAGEVAFAWLRGRSSYPQHLQAAEALLGLQGLRLLHMEGDDAAAQVEFADDQARHRIAVRRSAQAHSVLAGCDKTALKAIYPFERC